MWSQQIQQTLQVRQQVVDMSLCSNTALQRGTLTETASALSKTYLQLIMFIEYPFGGSTARHPFCNVQVRPYRSPKWVPIFSENWHVCFEGIVRPGIILLPFGVELEPRGCHFLDFPTPGPSREQNCKKHKKKEEETYIISWLQYWYLFCNFRDILLFFFCVVLEVAIFQDVPSFVSFRGSQGVSFLLHF